MNTTDTEKTLSTADLAATAERPQRAMAQGRRGDALRADERLEDERLEGERPEDEQLAELFSPEKSGEFRSQWNAVQIGFVDDPRQAVQRADELVAQVMKNLAETFASERARLEEQMNATDGSASTESLRMALRSYRSFFERLLSL